MSRKTLTEMESENGIMALADIMRNGLLVIHKMLIDATKKPQDAQKYIDKADHRIQGMMGSLKGLIDNARGTPK